MRTLTTAQVAVEHTSTSERSSRFVHALILALAIPSCHHVFNIALDFVFDFVQIAIPLKQSNGVSPKLVSISACCHMRKLGAASSSYLVEFERFLIEQQSTHLLSNHSTPSCVGKVMVVVVTQELFNLALLPHVSNFVGIR